MRELVVIAAFMMLVVGCVKKESEDTIKGSQDFSGVEFPITVHVFETKSEMHKHLRENKIERRKVQGKASWLVAADMSVLYECDIYVVKPKGVNDNNKLETWGHELAHCVYGTYHPE